MSRVRSPEVPIINSPPVSAHTYPEYPVIAVSDMKSRQSLRIREIRAALATAGFNGLDQQAEALGLSRSTAYTILKGDHKEAGRSSAVIERMLGAPLPPPLAR